MKRIIPVVIIFAIILFFGHVTVYELLAYSWPQLVIQNAVTRIVVIAVVALSFFISSIITAKSKNKVGQLFYTLTALWIGLFVELLLASALWIILFLLFPVSAQLLGQILSVVALCIFILGAINARIIRTTTYSVALPHIPAAWKQKNVVLLADLHLGAVNNQGYARRILRKLEAMQPDLIFLVGDFFDGVKVDEEELARVFSPLKEKILFVTGNHDGFVTSEKEIHSIQSAGIRVLTNELVEIDGVQIVGMDYHSTNKREKFEQVLKHVPLDPATPSILLKHVPLDLDLAEQKGFSLSLSGHTHNGQIFPGSYFAKRAHKGFNYGLKMLADMQVLVTSGVGTWGPPVRVGTRSEIVVIHFI